MVDVELTRDDVEFVDVAPCVACQDSGDDCLLCSAESVEVDVDE